MSKQYLQLICERIGEELRALAEARCRGSMTEEEFTRSVLRIEAQEVRPQGMTLTASNTLDDWTVFQLRLEHCEESCATFEFLPKTGQFRKSGSGP